MKPDAFAMLHALYSSSIRPRDSGARLGTHPKRVASLCHRWDKKGWYEWGVSIDLGWLTAEGRLHVGLLITRFERRLDADYLTAVGKVHGRL